MDKEILMDILQDFAFGTVRNPLDVGFVHSPVSIKEYQTRIEFIREEAIRAIEILNA